MQSGTQVYQSSYGFAVRYSLTAMAIPGYDVSELLKLDFHHKLGVDAKAPVLMPRGNIQFDASFELSSIGTTLGTPDLEIGFVQSVSSAVQVATYGNNQELRSFICDHGSYPVKDGTGEPWYKEEVKLKELFRMKSRPITAAPIRASISVHDRPKFVFPKLLGSKTSRTAKGVVGLKFQSASSLIHFTTCFAIKIGARLHPIHSFTWKFEARAVASTGPGAVKPVTTPQAEEQGLIVISQFGPYPVNAQFPNEIKLDGTPANESERFLLEPP